MVVSSAVSVVDTSKSSTYSVFASHVIANEGANVKFTVETTDVPNGTILFWAITGTVNQQDIDLGSIAGTLEIQSNRGEVTIKLIEDFFTEGAELLNFEVRKTATGTSVATTSLTVSDISLTPVYTFTPNVTTASEGDTISWNLTATNTPNGTQLYYNNIGTTTTSDFTTADGGTITVTSGTAQITLTLLNDAAIDPGETIRLALRTGSISGPIKIISNVVTVN